MQNLFSLIFYFFYFFYEETLQAAFVKKSLQLLKNFDQISIIFNKSVILNF
jgi:hypothetical protein